MPELTMTIVYNNQNLIGFGGNQDWFLDSWAKKAGCASVLGSNMYVYYMNIEESQKDEFLSMMNDFYSYMTPGRMGFPFFINLLINWLSEWRKKMFT